jgi:hypothetical protein
MASSNNDKIPILKPTWTTYAYAGLALVVAVLFVWGMIIASNP